MNNNFMKDNNSINNKEQNGNNSIPNNYSQGSLHDTDLNNTFLLEKEILDNRGTSNVDDDNVKMIKTKIKNQRENYVEKLDKIKPKNFKKRRYALIIVCLAIISSAFVVSSSFANLTSTSNTPSTSKIEAGVLNLDFSKGNEAITLTNALPQTDNDALVNNNEYQFTITNTGNIPNNYSLNLNNTCSQTQKYKINHKEVTPDLCIPNYYIKVGLSKNGNDYKIISGTELSNTLTLDSGTLNVGERNNYKMKMWLSIETPNEYNAKNKKIVMYSGNINIVYNQIDTNEVNESGTLDNISDNNSNNIE